MVRKYATEQRSKCHRVTFWRVEGHSTQIPQKRMAALLDGNMQTIAYIEGNA